MGKLLMLGTMARRTGLLERQLRALCLRNEVPYTMVGHVRAFDPKAVKAIREAAVRAGYLSPEPAAA